MLGHLLITFAALLAMLGSWVTVQAVARRFARRHPEFGTYREAGGGCGGGCGGCGQTCANDQRATDPVKPHPVQQAPE